MIIRYVFRVKLRFSGEELLIGDVAVRGEEAYPQEDALFEETAALRLPRRRRCCSIMCVRYRRAGGNGARARRPARSA